MMQTGIFFFIKFCRMNKLILIFDANCNFLVISANEKYTLSYGNLKDVSSTCIDCYNPVSIRGMGIRGARYGLPINEARPAPIGLLLLRKPTWNRKEILARQPVVVRLRPEEIMLILSGEVVGARRNQRQIRYILDLLPACTCSICPKRHDLLIISRHFTGMPAKL
jgi:hypothetical protein